MFKICIILFIIYHECSAVIHNLNDSEYRRMPALFALDDYDSCLSENDGAFCVLKLDLISEPDNELMKLIEDYSNATLKHYNHSYIERGVCVQKTCSEFVKNYKINETVDLRNILEECLNDTIYKDYGLQAKITKPIHCNKKNEGSKINTLDWCVAGIFCAILLVNFVGTLYDLIRNKNYDEKDKGNKYILSFSVMRNWKWLVNSEFDDPKLKRLKSFYGARTITNLLVVFGHTVGLVGIEFTDRPHEYEKTYDSPLYLLIYNGLMIVQVFFLMSGFLLVYNFLVRTENFSSRINWSSIPVGVFLRWWRLTPALAVVMAFSVSWLRHIGSGPLWDLHVTNSVVADCRNYWWYHLLYLNNYIHDDKYCAMQTWHIAADSQLFVIGLTVLVTTISRGRSIILAILFILSLILPAFHVWLHDLDAVAFITPEFIRVYNSDTFFYLHIYGHNNLTSYIVGMVTAIIVFNWQNKGVNVSDNKLYITYLWLVIPGMVGVIYSANLFYPNRERPSLVVRMLYASLLRLVLSLIIAFGFVGLVMKCRIYLRGIIEWRGWVVPSRLTYSVYLLHFNFIYILLGIRHTMMPMSFWYLYIYHFGISTLSYLLAVPFFLLVEAPCNRLMKNITSNFLRSFKDNNTSVK